MAGKPRAAAAGVEMETEAPPEAPKMNTKKVTIPEDRKVEQLNPTRMKEAEFERQTYFAKAHENTKPEDLLDRAYWAHVATRLKPWDKVEVVANDGTWWAEFLVLEAGRTWAKVEMLRHKSLTASDVSASQATAMTPYEVVHRGTDSKWSVIRKSDRAVMHEGEETQGGAIDWLNERLKAGI